MKKVLLVDGNNILHRAYHGLPLLHTADGRYTNAVFGFLKMFRKIKAQIQPQYIAICFDKGKHTFRHQMYAGYKAQRKPTDPELVQQFPLIREVMALNGYYCLESDEYEADDLMGTLAKKAAAEGMNAVIFSGDKDLLQVLDDKITVISGKKQLTDFAENTVATFREKYDLEPIQLIDMKSLMGDASDNIPGIRGVGEKTALKYLSKYGTLESFYDHVDELPKGKTKEKILADRENAFLSKKLATICTEVPLDITWEDLIPGEKDYDKLSTLYRELDFRNELDDLKKEMPRESEYSYNLFDMEVKNRPFEIVIESTPDFLKQYQRIGLWAEKDRLIAATEDYHALFLSPEKDEETIRSIFANTTLKKYCADLKSLYHFALEHRLELKGVEDAVEILAYLDDPEQSSYQTSRLCFRYLKQDTYLFEEDRPLAETALIPSLCDKLREKLSEKDCLSLYTDVELPLVRVLANMEHQGIRVDRKTLIEISSSLGERIETATNRIYDYAGERFNLNSSRQTAAILFEKLHLPTGKKNKSGYSTDTEVLEGLKKIHPIAAEILNYRMLSKLKSTYSDALGKLIDEKTGRIHTKLLQTVTATGRLSSADPNLQNIPIRMEDGRKIRKAFWASDEDHILLSADYSQIELRLLAHFSGDPVLIDSFQKEEDIHRRTASEIYHTPLEEVTSEMRQTAKTVNFGIIYGMSSYSLGNDLGVSRNIAQLYIDNYFLHYPKVKRFMEHIIEDAKETGYTVTLMGRRRELPNIANKNQKIRAMTERMAMNTPLQGSAADIIKLAMVKLFRAMEERQLKSKLILQVHDELIIDCLKSELEEMKALLKDSMEQCVSLRVPLTVDMKTGKNWYETEKI